MSDGFHISRVCGRRPVLTENPKQQVKMRLFGFNQRVSLYFSWLQHFPRIHQILWVERLFQWMHDLHGRGSHLLTQQRPLPYAHSVLPCACASHGEGSPGGNSSLITTQHNVKENLNLCSLVTKYKAPSSYMQNFL